MFEIPVVEQIRTYFHIRSDIQRCVLCEFTCTALLILFGSAVNAQFILSERRYGDWLGVCLGWAFALIITAQMGFHISGSHMNPAVSFYLFTFGRLSFRRLFLYTLAQIAGAYVGSLVTFLVYYDAIWAFDGGVRYIDGPLATSGIFFPNPQKYLSIRNAIIDQVVGTALLCFCVTMITDRQIKIPMAMQPIMIGLVLTLIGLSMGMNAGYEINPARDLGPKLFALSVGYGWDVFSYNNYTWFWIPIIFPYVGAFIGSWLYQFSIGFHVEDDDDQKKGCIIATASVAS